jgi:hypothetical protein
MIDIDSSWTIGDITNKSEAIIRSSFSLTEELIILRKLIAVGMGMYELSPDEQAEVQSFFNTCVSAQMAGRAAKANLAELLSQPTDIAGPAE